MPPCTIGRLMPSFLVSSVSMALSVSRSGGEGMERVWVTRTRRSQRAGSEESAGVGKLAAASSRVCSHGSLVRAWCVKVRGEEAGCPSGVDSGSAPPWSLDRALARPPPVRRVRVHDLAPLSTHAASTPTRAAPSTISQLCTNKQAPAITACGARAPLSRGTRPGGLWSGHSHCSHDELWADGRGISPSYRFFCMG